MTNLDHRITENVTAVRERMQAAALRAGRRATDITLVAVTKYVGPPEVAAVVAAGCLDLGESRPQELWRKIAARSTPDLVRWHLIGHLQRNKARRTVGRVGLIHSCDSLRLLTEIDRIAQETTSRASVLLEINVSGDAQKHGFEPQEIEGHLATIAELQSVQVKGLMTMAALAGNADEARQNFSCLRELRDRLRANCPESICLDELSMGMTRDFEIAIEEGATIVRVGSALFEGVTP